MPKRHDTKWLIDKVFAQRGNEYEVIGEYVNINKNVLFRHNTIDCHHEFPMTPKAFLYQKQKCPIHRKNIKLTHKEYVDKLFKINKNLETLEEYTCGKNRIHVKCKLDGYDWYPMASSLIKSKPRGCPMCALRNNSGENAVLWNGGLTEIRKYLREKTKPWIIDSMMSNDNKCIITGVNNNKVVHHLNVQFYKILEEVFLETRIELKARIKDYTEKELKILSDLCLDKHYQYGLGVTLNKDIHNEFHKTYGSKDNNISQFVEFANSKGKDLSNYYNVNLLNKISN